MAICGSLEHIFEKPLPESPTLLESLSPWKQIKSMNTLQDSSFTEIFGELHFKENDQSSSFSSSSSLSSNSTYAPHVNTFSSPSKGGKDVISTIHYERKQHGRSESFSSMNSESLSMCTEGLGFESCDDVDDLLSDEAYNMREEKTSTFRRSESTRSKSSVPEFPPPISCIGRNGRPWVCFKSFRENGRFILKEIRIPTQEFLHASRENGCLKLRFVQSDDEPFEDEDEDEESVEENNEETRKE